MSGSEIQLIKFLGCSVVSFNSSMGFNSSPSTLSVTLAEDFDAGDNFIADDHSLEDELAATSGGTPFINGNPGSFAKFTIPGSPFNFVGIVTSYRRSQSMSGNLISLEMTDPRFLFGQIPIISDTNLTINTTGFVNANWNLLCAPAVFNNPIDLDWSSEGVRFDLLASAIADKVFSFYNTNFKLVFDSSFYSHLPGGYRLKQQVSSLEDVINQAARDSGIEWFVDISTGAGFYNINIKGIKRTNQYNFDSENGLRSFIEDRPSTVSSWEIGRELRQEPTVTMVLGDRVRTLWNTSPGGNFPFFCEFGNGMIIDRMFVSLDFITDQYPGSTAAIGLPSVTMKVSKTGTAIAVGAIDDTFGNSYIGYPNRTKSQPSLTRRGYIATETTLRAALHSKEAWVTAVFYEYKNPGSGSLYPISFKRHNSFDIGYGFGSPGSNTTDNFTMEPSSLRIFSPAYDFAKGNPTLTSTINNLSNATDEAIKEACYQATLRVAEEYYGKKFICRLPGSAICTDIGNSYVHNQKKIPIEYEIVDSAPDIAFYNSPTTVGLPGSLTLSDSSSFRNPNGLFKGFAYFSPTQILTSFQSYRLDQFDPSNLIRASADVNDIDPTAQNFNTIYYSGISIEPYSFDPRFAVVTLNQPLNCGMGTYRKVTVLSRSKDGRIATWSTSNVMAKLPTKTDKSGQYLELMSRVFSNLIIAVSSHANLKDSNSKSINVSFLNGYVSVDYYYYLQTTAISQQEHVGLGEYRLSYIDNINAGGFFIPLQWNYIKYGPWINGDNYSRPISLVEDSKLNPWTYGSYDRMNLAGSIIAERANTLTHTIAYATVSVEGYPEFNLGSELLSSGDNMCNMSDINMNYGSDGIKTTYKFKSFFGPVGFRKRKDIDVVSQNLFTGSSNKQDGIRVKKILEDIEANIFQSSGGAGGVNPIGNLNQGSYQNSGAGIDAIISSTATVKSNPTITAMGGKSIKAAAESSGDYSQIAVASLGSLFTPCSTYPAKISKGKCPTIEGGHIT